LRFLIASNDSRLSRFRWRGSTTTRRDDDTTKTKIFTSHFDGLLLLAAARFARWQE
jgi:hypothetical protein